MVGWDRAKRFCCNLLGLGREGNRSSSAVVPGEFAIRTEIDVIRRVRQQTGLEGTVSELAPEPGIAAYVDAGSEEFAVTSSWRVLRLTDAVCLEEEIGLENEIRGYYPMGTDVTVCKCGVGPDWWYSASISEPGLPIVTLYGKDDLELLGMVRRHVG